MKDRCTAIVLAAGQGQRMKSKVKKQFLSIAGKPIVYYALQCFEKASFINNVILVTSEDCVDYCQKKIVEKYGFRKVEKVVVGGKGPYDSSVCRSAGPAEKRIMYISMTVSARSSPEIFWRELWMEPERLVHVWLECLLRIQ